jgi:hypothetical protein
VFLNYVDNDYISVNTLFCSKSEYEYAVEARQPLENNGFTLLKEIKDTNKRVLCSW